MKNTTIILIILICIAIIAGALLVARMMAQPNLEKLLPTSTAVYIYISDLPLAKSNLKETAVYKATADLKLAEIWQKQIEDYYKKVENRIGFDIRNLEPYFTKDAALAVLELDKNMEKALFVFLANIKDSKKDLAKYIDELLKPHLLNQGYKVVSKNFKGNEYFIVASDKPILYYAFLGKVFIYAPKEDALLQVINLSQGQGLTLKGNKSYQRLKGKLSYRKGLFFYADMATIRASYERKFKEEEQVPINLYRLMGISSIRSFALNSFAEREGFRTRCFVQMEDDVPGIMQIVLKQKPRKINSPKYIPREFPLVNISAFNNPSQIWDDFLTQLSKLLPPQQFQAFQTRIYSAEKLLNIDLKKDILDCLGNEMAFCVQLRQPEGEEIKAPLELLEKGSFLLLMNVKRVKRFSAFLDRLMAAGDLYLQAKQNEEEYKGYKIKYLKGEKISPATPGYTFIEDFLLFSPHNESLKKAIDAYQAGKVLNTYADYLKSSEEMEDRISQAVYIDIREILKKAPILSLNLLMPEEKGDIEKEALQKELIQLSDKLFGSCVVTKVTKDGIMIDSYCALGPTSLLVGRTLFVPWQKIISELASKKIF